MIEKLININKILLQEAKDNEEKRKRKIIDDLLSDDKIFTKIDIETAYSLLKDLKINHDDLEKVYLTLI